VDLTINYTAKGDLGITASGWMVKRITGGWIVVDADDTYIGLYDTKADAEAVAIAEGVAA
jgi:hypothetical protein